MSSFEPQPQSKPPEHVKALLTALVVAGAIPVVALVVGLFVNIGSAGLSVIFAVAVVVVLLLLVRWLLLYRSHQAR